MSGVVGWDLSHVNREVVKGWVEALRSGEYEQGRGALKRIGDDGQTKFCCLGVFCDQAVKAGVISEGVKFDTVFKFGGSEAGDYLPEQVVKWAGLPGPDPTVAYFEGDPGVFWRPQVTLSGLNDFERKSFEEIADYIEATYLKNE